MNNEKIREVVRLAAHMVSESDILEEIPLRNGPNGLQCGFCLNVECITEVGEMYWHEADCDYLRFHELADEVLHELQA